MEWTQFIKAELLILIPVLYAIGIGLKKSKIKNKHIPVILGATGVILACLYVFATSPLGCIQDVFAALFLGLTQGVLCSAASTYADQLIKQIKKDE